VFNSNYYKMMEKIIFNKYPELIQTSKNWTIKGGGHE